MKINTIFLSLSLFTSISCLAQAQDRIWIFGDHGGIDFNDTSNVFSFYSGLNGYLVKYSCASISDSQGNLLFYVAADHLQQNGTRVFNKNDSIMVNGDSLQCHPTQSQGILILPFPADSNKYYIFHKTQDTYRDNLYYSIVNMTLDNGLGAVVTKNIFIPTDSLTDRTTAVKHANGRDWWLIQQRWDQPEYIKFLITPSGIQGPFIQNLGYSNPKNEFYGTSYFSRDGTKLASAGLYGNISIMDFDRCTGDISNYQQIGPNVWATEDAYLGCAFSPNGEVLYVANTYPYPAKFVYQYDLTAADIPASKQVINMYPDTGQLLYVQYAHMLLGADNRIYVSKGNGSGQNSNTVYTQNMDVILNPDVVGSGCDYQSNYFYLNGGRTTYGLPNMVNYNLGPVLGSICDSLTNGIGNPSKKSAVFTVGPNPVRDKIQIYWLENISGGKPFQAIILDSQGRVAKQLEMLPGSQTLDVADLKAGVYVLQLRTTAGVFSKRFVKVE